MFVRNLNIKRRKTVKSKGIVRRPEVKQFNMFTGASNYNSLHFRVWLTDPPDLLSIRPFDAYGFGWPAQGTDQHSRIGSKINLKWIRFKGYYNIYDTLISICHVKFYLIRSYNGLETFNFTDLFRNWEAVNIQNANIWDILTAMRHDYYKAVLDPNKVGSKYGLTVTKLFEITMHPSAHSQDSRLHDHNEVTSGNNAATGAITNPALPEVAGVSFKGESVGNFPIDIKVRVNETIDCDSCKYYYFYMVDYPYASDGSSYSNTSYYPNPVKIEGFDLNFFARGYFTDA